VPKEEAGAGDGGPPEDRLESGTAGRPSAARRSISHAPIPWFHPDRAGRDSGDHCHHRDLGGAGLARPGAALSGGVRCACPDPCARHGAQHRHYARCGCECLSLCAERRHPNPTTCDDDWANGWVVYVGNTSNFTLDDRLWIHQDSNAVAQSGGASRITYNDRGTLTSGNSTLVFCAASDATSVVVAPSGRVRLESGGDCS